MKWFSLTPFPPVREPPHFSTLMSLPWPERQMLCSWKIGRKQRRHGRSPRSP